LNRGCPKGKKELKMGIRNRTIVIQRDAVTTASQTDTYFGMARMPKAGRLVGAYASALTTAGSAARTFQVYCSNTSIADDTSANSTTAMLSTVITIADTPVPASGIVVGTNDALFVEGEYLYVKYTTGSGTTSTNTVVTLVVNY
jgi:hypothetical protein